jgi:HipA-like protein
MMTATVYRNGELAGYLQKTDAGMYQFTYTEAYCLDTKQAPISLTLPKQKAKFESPTLFAAFANLLAEGVNRQLQCRYLQIDENDDFSLLLATAQIDTVGAITIQKLENENFR